MYSWEKDSWPRFGRDNERLEKLLRLAHHPQGRMLGRMEGVGFQLRNEAYLHSITQGVIKSSEIEGKNLNHVQISSSIANILE